MRFYAAAEIVCNFMKRCFAHLVFVRIHRVGKIRCTVQDIEAECQKPIIMLRSLHGLVCVLHELWIYTKHGTWRYFRIGDVGMVEIDQDGNPISVPEMEPAASRGLAAAGGTGVTLAQS